jgi:cytochrome c2
LGEKPPKNIINCNTWERVTKKKSGKNSGRKKLKTIESFGTLEIVWNSWHAYKWVHHPSKRRNIRIPQLDECIEIWLLIFLFKFCKNWFNTSRIQLQTLLTPPKKFCTGTRVGVSLCASQENIYFDPVIFIC